MDNSINPFKLLLTSALFVVLTACGSGNGSSSASDPATKVEVDTDNDGIIDSADLDDDNDGVADTEDAFPLDDTESLDFDNDGIGNNADPDDDNDGVADTEDAFPLDNTESLDTDNDGIGNNADPDDDNDLVLDEADVDDDNNGLIEISSLEQLDMIRNNLSGTSLNDGFSERSEGCLNATCNGYELTQSLDFDINADGVMDELDAPYFDYDNDAQNNGWLPIGNNDNPFAAVFDGNGFEIRNLMINRPASDTQTEGNNIGLFGSTLEAQLRNIGLAGDLSHITGGVNVGSLIGNLKTSTLSRSDSSSTVIGSTNVGGLVGNAAREAVINSSHATGDISGVLANRNLGGLVGGVFVNTRVFNSYATGSVTGSSAVGGLVGFAGFSNCIIDSTFATGAVSANKLVGGLVGELNATQVSHSFATGLVSANVDFGGLIGKLSQNSLLIKSYWATDSSSIDNSAGSILDTSEATDVLGVTLAELECPTAANDITCSAQGTLYLNWDAIDHDKDANTDSIAPWVFGDSNTLPALLRDIELPNIEEIPL